MRKSLLIIASMSIAFLVSSPHPAAAADKLDDLKQERREVNRAIRKAVPDPTQLDPELAKLQRASLDASKAHLKALDEHPSLAAVNQELKRANDDLVKAMTAKDATAGQSARTRISELQHRRNDEAAGFPELAKLAEASNAAGSAYFAREKEFLASHPDTKDLTARLAKINEEIQAVMKQ